MVTRERPRMGSGVRRKPGLSLGGKLDFRTERPQEHVLECQTTTNGGRNSSETTTTTTRVQQQQPRETETKEEAGVRFRG